MTIDQVKITKILLCASAACYVAYDIFAYVYAGNPATLSRVIYQASVDFPIISFAAGVLCGHLFVPQHIVKEDSVSVTTTTTTETDQTKSV